MATDIIIIPGTGQMYFQDSSGSPQQVRLQGEVQNALYFAGDGTGGPTGSTNPVGGTNVSNSLIVITDSTTGTITPGLSGYDMGSATYRWNLYGTGGDFTGLVTLGTASKLQLGNTGGANGAPLQFMASASAPSSLSAGQMWWDGTNVNFYTSTTKVFGWADFSNVSGILGVTSGGTGKGSWTANSIPYISATNTFAEDTSGLVYSGSTNKELTVGINSFNARLTIAGTYSNNQSMLAILGSMTNSSANVFGVFVNGTYVPGSGNSVTGIAAIPQLASSNPIANAYGVSGRVDATSSQTATVTKVAGFYAGNPTKAGSATYTNYYGLYVEPLTVGGTGNFGVRAGVTSATGSWNFYADGTANNSFVGNTIVGSTTVPTTKLHVYGGDFAVDSVTAGSTTVSTGRLTYISSGGSYGTRTGSSISVAQIYGRVLNQNPDLFDGATGYSVYDNAASGHTVLSAVADSTNLNAPNASGNMLQIAYDGAGTPGTSPTPGFGGFRMSLSAGAGANGQITGFQYKRGSRIRQRIWANIPVGYTLAFASNATGTGGATVWLTSLAGTGSWYLYEMIQRIGETGSFGSTFFYYLQTGGTNTAFNWYVAQVVITDEDASPAVSLAPQLNIGYYQGANQGWGDLLNTGTAALALTVGSKVGIGTTAPAQLLDVAYGHMRFTQVPAPGALTSATGSAGSLTGNYYYVVTYVTANGETNIGTVSTVVAPSSQQINLTAIPTSTVANVTSRKIYRTTTGGVSTGPFFLLTTIGDNTTTTFTDNTVDGSLGASDVTTRENTTAGLHYVGTNKMGFIGANNVVFGNTGFYTTNLGTANVGIGTLVLNANTSGLRNTALGNQVLQQNTTGSHNTSVGHGSLSTNTTGQNNTGVGEKAIWQSVNSQNNVGLGYLALQGIVSASQVTGVGAVAAASVIFNNDITAIGYAADIFTPGTFTATATPGAGLNTGVYLYLVTFVVNGVETAPNVGSILPVSVTTTGPNSQVTLGSIPLYSGSYSGATRKIYRTAVGGTISSPFLLADTIGDNIQTSIIDSTPDGSLGAAIPTSGNSIMIGRNAQALYQRQLVIGSTAGIIADGFIGNGIYAASPQAITLHSTGGLGPNVAGANFVIAPGQGTGTAAGGFFSVQTAAAGSSSSVFNPLAEVFRIDSTGLTSVKGSFNAGSSAQMTVSTAGNIGTSGGYTQTGSTANTFSGATTFTASSTALTVNNNAVVSGLMGIGAGTSSVSQLSISASWGSSPADQVRGFNVNTTLTPSTNFNGSYGFVSNGFLGPATATTAGYMWSNFSQAMFTGTGGTVTSLGGAFMRSGMSGAGTTGTVSNGYGFYIDAIANQATSSPAVTFVNQFGVYINNQGSGSGSGGLTVTNAYGLYIANTTGAGTLNYALYSAGGAVYIKGAVTLDASGTGLSVTGNELISGNLTVPIVYGSSSSAGTLTLGSTSHATKGKILFGTSAYDEVNNRLGINISSPVQRLEIQYGGMRFDTLGSPTAPTISYTGTGLTGTWYYKVTYVTAYGETHLGTASAQASPSNQTVVVTIPTDATGNATGRKIYRTLTTAPNTGPFYLLTTINDNTTTSYNDSTVDGSLGVVDFTNRDNTTAGDIYKNGVLIGRAGFNSGNTVWGYAALASLTGGSTNTAIGNTALNALTTGGFNVALGHNALPAQTTGSGNIGIGLNVGLANISGSSSILIGASAGRAMTASNNTMVGYQSGYAPNGTTANATSSGANNTFLGFQTGAATSSQISTSIAIGYNAVVTGSNQAVIGGTGGNAVKVGINNNNPSTAQLSLVTDAVGTIGMLINGASGQTANLQNWSVNGSVLASINASGNFAANTTITINNISSGNPISFTSSAGVSATQAYILPTNVPSGAGQFLTCTSTAPYQFAWAVPSASSATVSIGSTVTSGTDTYILYITNVGTPTLSQDAGLAYNYGNQALNLAGTVTGFANLVVQKAAITTTSTPGAQIQNSTASTGGATQQQSPGLDFIGHVWNSSGTPADNYARLREELQVTSGGSPTSLFVWKTSVDTGTASFTNVMTLTNAGLLTVANGLTVTTGAFTLGSFTLTLSSSATLNLNSQALAMNASIGNFTIGAGVGSSATTHNFVQSGTTQYVLESATAPTALGDMYYASTSSYATMTKLSIGVRGSVMVANSATPTPTWLAPSSTAGVAIISGGTGADLAYGTIVVAGGGTGQTSFASTNSLVVSGSSSTGAFTTVTGASGLLYGTAANTAPVFTTSIGVLITFAAGLTITGAKTTLASSTTGYASANIPSGTAPTSPTSGDVWYDGTNLKFANGTNTVSLTTGVTWSVISGTSATMAPANGYISNNAGLVTLTMPTTAAVGTEIRVAGFGAGGWKIAQNTSQQIQFGIINTTAGVSGYLQSVQPSDGVHLVCVVANTNWIMVSSQGNITVN